MPIAWRNAPVAPLGGPPTAPRSPGSAAWGVARPCLLPGLLLAHVTAGAQTVAQIATQTAAPAAAHPVDGPSFVPMALALLLVLGLIAAALWVLRRAGLAPRGGSSALRLVTQLALGPRERVVIVEVGDRWWLLGVGAGGITRLGSVPKGEAATPVAPAASFGAMLDKLRGGGT